MSSTKDDRRYITPYCNRRCIRLDTLNMLRAVLFVGCAAAVFGKLDDSLLSDEAKDLMNGYHQTCVDKTGVSEDKIKAVNDGHFPDDKDIKCYTKCILTESGTMDGESGEINYDVMKRFFSDDLYDKIRATMATCIDRTDKTDLCEKSYDLFKCYYNINEEYYFLA